MTMPRVTQFTVCLENKPGTLARMGEVLRKAKVNLLALSVVDSAEACLVRMIVDNTAKGGMALTRAGMKPIREPVLALDLPNEPGALAEVAALLAKADVNVSYVYGSAPRGAETALAVLGVDDLRKALEVV
jgi:hypothetical protein